jgi:hypothetical protein
MQNAECKMQNEFATHRFLHFAPLSLCAFEPLHLSRYASLACRLLR